MGACIKLYKPANLAHESARWVPGVLGHTFRSLGVSYSVVWLLVKSDGNKRKRQGFLVEE